MEDIKIYSQKQEQEINNELEASKALYENRFKTYISLFSSAGVGCYGFKQADFKCIATVELLAERMAVQKANRKCNYDSGYIVGDILQETTKRQIFKEIDFWNNFHGIKQVDESNRF